MHSYVSQRLKITHCHSPSYVSLTLRKAELTKTHAESIDVLVACAEKVRDRLKVIDELGLTAHPAFDSHRDVLSGGVEASVPHGLVNKVITD